MSVQGGRRVWVEDPSPAIAPGHLAHPHTQPNVSSFNKLFVVGESAGGNLALKCVLNSVASPSLACPLAVALFSPWVRVPRLLFITYLVLMHR